MSLIGGNRETLLSRIPTGHAMRAAAASVISVAERFTGSCNAIDGSPALTPTGKSEKVRATVPEALRELIGARTAIKTARAKLNERRKGLKLTQYDPENAAAAIERSEIRSYLRSLDKMALTVIAETTKDARLLEAMLSAPQELSGFDESMQRIAESVERRYLHMLNGSEIDEIERQEAIVAEAEAISNIAASEIQTRAGLTDQEIQSETVPLERKASAPWLQRDGDRIVRVKPGEQYPPWPDATPQEMATGVYYSNLDAFAQANGFASGADFKAQHEASRNAAAQNAA